MAGILPFQISTEVLKSVGGKLHKFLGEPRGAPKCGLAFVVMLMLLFLKIVFCLAS